MFSCTEFDKGDFLLEYRGDLISKAECERRQRVYHDALKVFLFEFRYDGKLLWYVHVLNVQYCAEVLDTLFSPCKKVLSQLILYFAAMCH